MKLKQQTPEQAATEYDPDESESECAYVGRSGFLAGVKWRDANPDWRSGEPQEPGAYYVLTKSGLAEDYISEVWRSEQGEFFDRSSDLFVWEILFHHPKLKLPQFTSEDE